MDAETKLFVGNISGLRQLDKNLDLGNPDIIYLIRYYEAIVTHAEQAATAAERKRCAEIARNWGGGTYIYTANMIAKAIEDS